MFSLNSSPKALVSRVWFNSHRTPDWYISSAALGIGFFLIPVWESLIDLARQKRMVAVLGRSLDGGIPMAQQLGGWLRSPHFKEPGFKPHIFIAFLAYCLHVTLNRRLHPLAPGLTPCSVIEKFPPCRCSMCTSRPTVGGSCSPVTPSLSPS